MWAWREPMPCKSTASPAQSADSDAAALATYKDFVTLWTDADSNIPNLKEAKAEYAKVRRRN
jgi:hypothetical protein